MNIFNWHTHLSEFANDVTAEDVVENGLKEGVGEQDEFEFVAVPEQHSAFLTGAYTGLRTK